ncbi:MAG: hypothetical protein M3P39_05710, partial [Actinomycetota bacterium]|nr:hypothetical protein [Actinomycetota bacterium]
MRTVLPRTIRVQFATAVLALATALPACGGNEPQRPAAERAPAPATAPTPAPRWPEPNPRGK